MERVVGLGMERGGGLKETLGKEKENGQDGQDKLSMVPPFQSSITPPDQLRSLGRGTYGTNYLICAACRGLKVRLLVKTEPIIRSVLPVETWR